MTGSKIEWCDHTFNPWEGCTKVSEGCRNCYAEARDKRFHGRSGHWGAGVPRRRTSAANWLQPLRWQKIAERGFFVEVRRDGAFVARGDVRKLSMDTIRPGDRVVQVRPRVFCASLADWLDDEVPVEWLADLLWLMQRTPGLDWLLLTKRPENFDTRLRAAYLAQPGACGHSYFMALWTSGQPTPPANVWIGTSVETQRTADARIPALLKIPARVRFLSCEPLLGTVDVTRHLATFAGAEGSCGVVPNQIHWIICGGESGDGARPMHVKWARALRDQCATAGMAFFFKQWGEHVDIGNMPDETVEFMSGAQGPGLSPLYWKNSDGVMTPEATYRVGKRAAGRTLDGVVHGVFPVVVNTEVSNAGTKTK